jgi:hypothetical protein
MTDPSMKTRPIAAAVLVAFLASSLPHASHAEDDAVTTQARTRFREGVDFYDKGSFENARLAFLQAYALKKHPAVLLNLAQSSAKAGHALEAAKYFQQFLRDSTSATPQQRQDAEGGLAEVRQKLGRIDVVAPSGTEVTLDERERLGTTPLSDLVDVEPGPHTVRSSSETVRVSVNAGQRVQAKFAQSTVVPSAPTPTAVPSAEANALAVTLPTKAPSEAPATTSIEPLPMWPGYLGLGVAGAALVSTVVFAAFKASAQSSADSVANDIRTAAGSRAAGICASTSTADVNRFGAACKTLKENNDSVDTDALVANVSFGVFAVGAVFATAWLIAVPAANRKRAEPNAAQVPSLVPYLGHREGGLTLVGRF